MSNAWPQSLIDVVDRAPFEASQGRRCSCCGAAGWCAWGGGDGSEGMKLVEAFEAGLERDHLGHSPELELVLRVRSNPAWRRRFLRTMCKPAAFKVAAWRWMVREAVVGDEGIKGSRDQGIGKRGELVPSVLCPECWAALVWAVKLRAPDGVSDAGVFGARAAEGWLGERFVQQAVELLEMSKARLLRDDGASVGVAVVLDQLVLSLGAACDRTLVSRGEGERFDALMREDWAQSLGFESSRETRPSGSVDSEEAQSKAEELPLMNADGRGSEKAGVA